MKKEGMILSIFAIVVLMLIFSVFLINSISAQDNQIKTKNIFQKAWENIKDSYLKVIENAAGVTGNVIGGCSPVGAISPCSTADGCESLITCLSNGEWTNCICNNNCPTGQTRCSDGVCRSSCNNNCPTGQTRCSDGVCRSSCGCFGSCSGKECGNDGCNRDCGECGTGKKCDNFKCVDNPLCKKNKIECGNNEKTGYCGKCPIGMFCTNGKCCDGCKIGEQRCKEGDNKLIQTCKKYLTCTRWYDSNCKEGEFCNKEAKKCVACSPDSCEDYDFFSGLFGEGICGEWDDGCGGKLDCGRCENELSCDNGFCRGIECKKDEDCGKSGDVGNSYCSFCDDKLHKNYVYYKCENPGYYDSRCVKIEKNFIYKTCSFPYHGCFNGECKLSACNSDSDCNSLNELCPRTCDIIQGICKPSSSCIASCQMTGECKNSLDQDKCDDDNPCTKDYCNLKEPGNLAEPVICSHSCSTTGKISGAPGTWGAVDWSDSGAKIWTVSELIAKFKKEELGKKENEYNNKNIENFDKIIANDPQLVAAIIYKKLIFPNRLTYIIFYEGDKQVDPLIEKNIKKFIKSMNPLKEKGKPFVITDIDGSKELQIKFLLIDVSCKQMSIFNNMQEIKTIADVKTYPQFGLSYWRNIIKDVSKEYKMLLNLKGGVTFLDKLTPIMPFSLRESGESSGIGIAIYTNVFGSFVTFVPSSSIQFFLYEIYISKTFFSKKTPKILDSFYNLARFSISSKDYESKKSTLEEPITEILDKLKKPIPIKEKDC